MLCQTETEMMRVAPMTREQTKIILVLVPVKVGSVMTLVHEREEAKASNCIILFLSMHLRDALEKNLGDYLGIFSFFSRNERRRLQIK